MKLSANAVCPCGSGCKYKKCCGPLHEGQAATGVEALMRSRYTAYALHNVDYIMQTTHPASQHFGSDAVRWRHELEVFCQHTRFAGLKILATTDTTVTFYATLYEGLRDVSFTEHSLFSQLDGRWLYLQQV